MFDAQKLSQLSRGDFSRKGSIDRAVEKLVNKINRGNNYYTTSSCSGRIILLTEGDKKHDTKWQFVSHSRASLKEIGKSLKKLPEKPLWFRFEPMILHVACRTIEDANAIARKARASGFKHSGIMEAENRIIAEIRGTDFISAIISKNGKLIVNSSYLKILADEANKKLKRNLEKIKKFEKLI